VTPLKLLLKQASEDIRHGHYREAYALFLIGVALVALGLAGIADIKILLSAILLAITFLVFHTARETSHHKLSLDEVLQTRDSFEVFSKTLRGVKDLRVYGPTAVNILTSAGDIRRFILNAGGSARIIIQSDRSETLAQTAVQLDDNLDLARTLQGSISTLEKLSEEHGFSYRRLPFNPGFSLVIINARSSDGYLIFESHGFKDENIADRMHVVIRRHESPHWFEYWVSRFEEMWDTAAQPEISK
jgi:hypothetical protein